MLTVGCTVRVCEPFTTAFPDVYVVEAVADVEGGTVVMLEGVESAFDPKYLEVVDV